MTAQFKHYDLRIVTPAFDSPLMSHIIELEKLRRSRISDSVPPEIFEQLKKFFHKLESLGSARIEGNNTTVSELVERQISDDKDITDKQRELDNTEQALDFIEENASSDLKINQAFISELHKIVVDRLSREGSLSPGLLRNRDVEISGSSHKPPSHLIVRDYFDGLINFINEKREKQYNLLVTALAHHRFAWIHPFDNGNGRVVRLLTYAMLIKQKFHLKGRILNPTAIFCIDRNKYYEMLAKGDSGDDAGLLTWCEYVLEGLLNEINKIDKLSDKDYLVKNILLPALAFCLERENITREEYDILKLAVTKPDMEIAASNVNKIIPSKHAVQTSRKINSLREKKMLKPVTENGRKYIISFADSIILRGIRDALQKAGFIGIQD